MVCMEIRMVPLRMSLLTLTETLTQIRVLFDLALPIISDCFFSKRRISISISLIKLRAVMPLHILRQYWRLPSKPSRKRQICKHRRSRQFIRVKFNAVSPKTKIQMVPIKIRHQCRHRAAQTIST